MCPSEYFLQSFYKVVARDASNIVSSSAAHKRGPYLPSGSSRGLIRHALGERFGPDNASRSPPPRFRFSLLSLPVSSPSPTDITALVCGTRYLATDGPSERNPQNELEPDQHIARPLHLTWPLSSSLPLSPVFFNPSFPLTLPSSPFIVILPLLSHRIGQRRPFREGHQSRLSICNGDSLCPSRGGSRQSTLYLSPSTLAHRRFLRLLRCLLLSSSHTTPRVYG